MVGAFPADLRLKLLTVCRFYGFSSTATPFTKSDMSDIDKILILHVCIDYFLKLKLELVIDYLKLG